MKCYYPIPLCPILLLLSTPALSLPAETQTLQEIPLQASNAQFEKEQTTITTEEPLIIHSVKKKGGVLEGNQVTPVSTVAPEVVSSLEEILLSILTSKNGSISASDLEDPAVKASLALLADGINSLFDADSLDSTYSSEVVDIENVYTVPTISVNPEPPKLQFLEPDLGPAVLPLKVPDGYFVPFIPRQAFGVTNGVSRPSHGHASFYRYRPSGLVDVRNSPAFGFLLAGP